MKALKKILWIYIVLCFIIAGLNYGLAPKASPKTAEFINWFWHFYENWIKTAFIIIGSYLTIKIISKSGRTEMRKKNLIGLICAALVVHIILPLVLNNKEVYFFALPLPWSTTPLQLMYNKTAFYESHIGVWGLGGIAAILIVFLIISIVVFVGTVIFGRRWQCSTICLFNGFASEVFSPVTPLLGKSKKLSASKLKVLTFFKWLFFALGLLFTIWWILFLSGVDVPGNFKVMEQIELYKYLCADLLVMMFFWVVFTGRGYCYYCPLGTFLSLISRLAGQKISTDKSECIKCGKCNKACPMAIDIKTKAQDKKDVKELRCVGCGHCIDACPTKTLSYETKIIKRLY